MIGIMYWTIFRRAERPAKPAAAPPS
jgi:hypothetical protein